MEKRPLTLFFMDNQTLRAERRWSLLLMQMHFLLVCLAPLGLVFYAFLFYSAGEQLVALLALAMLFPTALILRGMWWLHFWAFAALLLFITVVSIAGFFQDPPLRMSTREISGWIWAVISTCAAWRVRQSIRKECVPVEQDSTGTSNILPKHHTAFIKNTIFFLVVCLMPLSYLHLQDTEESYNWAKRYYTKIVTAEKPVLPHREVIPEPVAPTKPSPPPKRPPTDYARSLEESIVYEKQLYDFRAASIAYDMERRRYEVLQEVRRADEQKFQEQLKEWEYLQSIKESQYNKVQLGVYKLAGSYLLLIAWGAAVIYICYISIKKSKILILNGSNGTLSTRLGLLVCIVFLPLLVLSLWPHVLNYREPYFYTSDFAIVSIVLCAIALCAGLLLYFGYIQRLIAWIKTGK